MDNHGSTDLEMLEREAKVLELLIKDGYFNQTYFKDKIREF